MARRDPTPTFIFEGAGKRRREIAIVPLSKGEYAQIYANDYDRLMHIKVTPFWSYDRSAKDSWSVRFNSKTKRQASKETTNVYGGGATAVARVLLGLLQYDGLAVSYADNDPKNLRRENLLIRPQGKGNPHPEFPAALARREQRKKEKATAA